MSSDFSSAMASGVRPLSSLASSMEDASACERRKRTLGSELRLTARCSAVEPYLSTVLGDRPKSQSNVRHASEPLYELQCSAVSPSRSALEALSGLRCASQKTSRGQLCCAAIIRGVAPVASHASTSQPAVHTRNCATCRLPWWHDQWSGVMPVTPLRVSIFAPRSCSISSNVTWLSNAAQCTADALATSSTASRSSGRSSSSRAIPTLSL
mmetsp:Transcript_6542/g.16928  ORF Transcript_6542/g.16928 Transcript_6542/m.16928 type:complete len:211 (+) Transcript_6542:615-1247(+)